MCEASFKVDPWEMEHLSGTPEAYVQEKSPLRINGLRSFGGEGVRSFLASSRIKKNQMS